MARKIDTLKKSALDSAHYRGHPMFETREQMEARKAASNH